eukprot:Clim_evm4s2 gene=Clim_evmTU4s2
MFLQHRRPASKALSQCSPLSKLHGVALRRSLLYTVAIKPTQPVHSTATIPKRGSALPDYVDYETQSTSGGRKGGRPRPVGSQKLSPLVKTGKFGRARSRQRFQASEFEELESDTHSRGRKWNPIGAKKGSHSSREVTSMAEFLRPQQKYTLSNTINHLKLRFQPSEEQVVFADRFRDLKNTMVDTKESDHVTLTGTALDVSGNRLTRSLMNTQTELRTFVSNRARSGEPRAALELINHWERHHGTVNPELWNRVLQSAASQGKPKLSLHILRRMRATGAQMSKASYVCMLDLWHQMDRFDLFAEILQDAERNKHNLAEFMDAVSMPLSRSHGLMLWLKRARPTLDVRPPAVLADANEGFAVESGLEPTALIEKAFRNPYTINSFIEDEVPIDPLSLYSKRESEVKGKGVDGAEGTDVIEDVTKDPTPDTAGTNNSPLYLKQLLQVVNDPNLAPVQKQWMLETDISRRYEEVTYQGHMELVSMGKATSMSVMKRLMRRWFESALEKVEEQRTEILNGNPRPQGKGRNRRNGGASRQGTLRTFLNPEHEALFASLNPRVSTWLALNEIVNRILQNPQGVLYGRLAQDIGFKLKDEHMLDILKNATTKTKDGQVPLEILGIAKAYDRLSRDGTMLDPVSRRQAMDQVRERFRVVMDDQGMAADWDLRSIIAVGGVYLNHVVDSISLHLDDFSGMGPKVASLPYSNKYSALQFEVRGVVQLKKKPDSNALGAQEELKDLASGEDAIRKEMEFLNEMRTDFESREQPKNPFLPNKGLHVQGIAGPGEQEEMDAQEMRRKAQETKEFVKEAVLQPNAWSQRERLIGYDYLHRIGNAKDILGVLKPNRSFVKWLQNQITRGDDAPISARQLPMVSMPLPWVKYNRGGYLTNNRPLMRTAGAPQQTARLAQASDRMSEVYDALNTLSATRWRVNHRVLAVATRVWNEGGNPDLDIPTMEDLTFENVADNANMTYLERYEARMRHAEIAKTNAERHSDRCSVQYQLLIAHGMRNVPFYFPHNLDFRGRAYPIPPHLNHLGNDLCRGMLLFDEPKLLGERGLYWLKVHMANMYGKDKLPFEERVAFTEDHMSLIRNSAEYPLKGQGWWMEADKPWQCLATAMELTRAYDHPEGPEKYMCRMPVHADGSCNGLQHYAALGGDVAGASAVNLLPHDRPQDVYTEVADIVRRKVREDAEQGNDVAQLVADKIVRKVVKQTVMTSVYGVTFIGAREQISRQLREIYGFDMRNEMHRAAGMYLARLTFDSMRELFTSARAIQEWLADSAKEIADTGRPVAWFTPLGLPIIQPYHKPLLTRVKSKMGTIGLILDRSGLTAPAVQRQKAAFPPNFVHSLDSTHMLMTAIRCRNNGLTFASVHDSFWTHATDIDEMGQLLRGAFVELHEQPILKNLEAYFKMTYGYSSPEEDFLYKESMKSTEELKDAAARDKNLFDSPAHDAVDSSVAFGSPSESSLEDSDPVSMVENTESFGKKTKKRPAASAAKHLKPIAARFPPLPRIGDLNLEDVRKSPYFFS